jgi:hypothetical protein
MTVNMNPDADFGRAKDRIRKTLSLPDALVETIQREADEKYAGDFTRAVLEKLAEEYQEARDFLEKNTTSKHSRKKI